MLDFSDRFFLSWEGTLLHSLFEHVKRWALLNQGKYGGGAILDDIDSPHRPKQEFVIVCWVVQFLQLQRVLGMSLSKTKKKVRKVQSFPKIGFTSQLDFCVPVGLGRSDTSRTLGTVEINMDVLEKGTEDVS